MKNYSAPRLLRMALSGEHVARCPHANSKVKTTDCVCWPNEVRRWDEHVKAVSKLRVSSIKRRKVHFLGCKCGAKIVSSTSVKTDVTCGLCLRLMDKPAKTTKSHKKTVSTIALTN